MKANEIRSKSAAEINESLLNVYREQFNLKMQKATGQMSKPDQISRNRKNIARLLTILKEREKNS